jgi:hypothetical protein
MRSPNLALTLIGKRFSLTPLPGHIVSCCTADEACGHSATHRLLSHPLSSAKLLCDTHTLAWAQQHGHSVTTAREVVAV